MFGDGKTEPCAADFPRTRDVHPVKALENAGLVCFRNADSRIRDGDNHFRCIGLGADRDLAARRRVLHGIVDQVLQNLGQPAAVASDIRQRPCQLYRESQISFSGARLRRFDAAFNELLNRQAANFKFEPLGITVASSSPEALGVRVRTESELWGPVIKAANIKGE